MDLRGNFAPSTSVENITVSANANCNKHRAMKAYLLNNDIRVRPPDPVELVVAVDGRTLRVAIEWSALEPLVGGDRVDEAALREFIHRHRHEIELAIKSHIFAYGFPFSGLIVMSRDELDWIVQPGKDRAATGGDASARA